MTRETKAGLVVSGAFLSLVGIVVYCQFKGGNQVAPNPYANAGTGLTEVPAEPTPAPSAASALPSAGANPPPSAAAKPDPLLAVAPTPPRLDPSLQRAAVLNEKTDDTSKAADPPSPPAGGDSLFGPSSSAPSPAAGTASSGAKENTAQTGTPASGIGPEKSEAATSGEKGKAGVPVARPGADAGNVKPKESSPFAASQTSGGTLNPSAGPFGAPPTPEATGNSLFKSPDPAAGGSTGTPVSAATDPGDAKPGVPKAPSLTPDPSTTGSGPTVAPAPPPAPVPQPPEGAGDTTAKPNSPPSVSPSPETGSNRFGGPPRDVEAPAGGPPAPGAVSTEETSTAGGSTGGTSTGAAASGPSTPSVAPPPTPANPSPVPGTGARRDGESPFTGGPAAGETNPALAPSRPDGSFGAGSVPSVPRAGNTTDGLPGTRPLSSPTGGDSLTGPNVKMGAPMSTRPPAEQVAQGRNAGGADPTFAGSGRSFPPVGAPPTASSPPIAVPMPGAYPRAGAAVVPQVVSYDEETYLCKANDSFDEISGRYYQNKAYGKALMLYNRSHPRRAAALWKDPPELQEGQAIYIPPLAILEKQFGHEIPGHKPLPPVAVPASGTGADTSWSSPPRSGPQYVVRKPEMIRDIAAAALGNWERWVDIYQLNARGFEPSRPLPVGTALVMPAGAQVPPENRP